MAKWADFQQEVTEAHARRRGYAWTQTEVTRLAELRKRMTVADAALELERTYFGAQAMAHRLDVGDWSPDAARDVQAVPAYRGWTADMPDDTGLRLR